MKLTFWVIICKDRKWTITKEIEKLHRINLRKNDYENGVGGGNDFVEKYRPLVGNGDDEKLT